MDKLYSSASRMKIYFATNFDEFIIRNQPLFEQIVDLRHSPTKLSVILCFEATTNKEFYSINVHKESLVSTGCQCLYPLN
jgi:hypothetical protein